MSENCCKFYKLIGDSKYYKCTSIQEGDCIYEEYKLQKISKNIECFHVLKGTTNLCFNRLAQLYHRNNVQ